MRVSRLVSVSLATALVFGLSLPLIAAQEPDTTFDPVAGTYEYVQPDPAGDGTASGNPKFGDITSFAIHQLTNGSLLLQMKFADLAGATGDLRFCAFFTVDGTAYQTGIRGRFVNGAPDSSVAVTPCSWTDSGASVGTPTMNTANDQVHIIIPPHQIAELVPGAVLEGINVQIGAVVPGVGQGDPELFDVLTPSIDPVDYAYEGSNVPDDLISVVELGGNTTIIAAPGENATFSLNLTNRGETGVVVNLSLMPNGDSPFYNGTIEPATVQLGPNETKDLTVTVPVPANATAGPKAMTLMVSTSSGTVDISMMTALEILVEVPTPSESAEPTAADNATAAPASVTDGEGVPGPGVVGFLVAAALVAIGLRRRRA